MVGIYKITNPKGKVYIGYSKDIENRFKYYKRLNCKGQRKLYNSLKKYGPDNHIFEIVEECNLVDLNLKEIYWIEIFNSIEGGLNLTSGGEGNNPSLETKKLMSESHKGKKLSKEIKDKISKGKVNHSMYTDEWREKISESLKGRNILWGDKISKSTIGRTSPFIGRKHTDETKKLMSESRKSAYKNTHKFQPILQYDKKGNFIKEWNSVVEAERAYHPQKKRSTNISSCCIGKQKTAYGFIWKHKK